MTKSRGGGSGRRARIRRQERARRARVTRRSRAHGGQSARPSMPPSSVPGIAPIRDAQAGRRGMAHGRAQRRRRRPPRRQPVEAMKWYGGHPMRPARWGAQTATARARHGCHERARVNGSAPLPGCSATNDCAAASAARSESGRGTRSRRGRAWQLRADRRRRGTRTCGRAQA
jgi:hypothetical protein